MNFFETLSYYYFFHAFAVAMMVDCFSLKFFQQKLTDTQIFNQNVNKRDKKMVKIFEDIDFKRDPSGELEKLLSIEEDSLYPLVKLCIFAGSSRKASGITALRISHLSEIASFMIILEGNSR